MLPLPLAVLALFGTAASAAAPPCVPSHPVRAEVRAGDSVVVNGQRVPRTAAAVRRAHLGSRVRIDGPAFYAGERVVVAVDGQRRGTAVYDGCALVPESRGVAVALRGRRTEAVRIGRAGPEGYQRVELRTAAAVHPHP